MATTMTKTAMTTTATTMTKYDGDNEDDDSDDDSNDEDSDYDGNHTATELLPISDKKNPTDVKRMLGLISLRYMIRSSAQTSTRATIFMAIIDYI